uniref:CBF domain-containing protein n=1 Tax=Echinostoma caproni TaxID=27848 RepID=A0A183BB10_9TREM
LRNLIEGSHLFISMLADRMKSGAQTMFVRRKKVIRRARQGRRTTAATSGRKKNRSGEQEEEEDESPEIRLMRIEYQWNNQLLPELVNILENPAGSRADEENDAESSDDDPEKSRLFDAVAGGSEAKQLRSAVRRVQANLYAGRAAVAFRLARRMWRLWPEVAPTTVDENDPVLNSELVVKLPPSSVSVLSALRQIHITELQDEDEELDAASDGDGSGAEAEDEMDDLYNEEMGLEGSDDERGLLVTVEKEVQMDLTAFVFKFAHPKIVHALTLCLSDFETNPASTNSAVVHIIHRLAVKHKLVGSFFQLRLFYVFQKFLHNSTLLKSKEFKKALEGLYGYFTLVDHHHHQHHCTA